MVSAPEEVADSKAIRPLVVGITGHRDLVAKELPGIEATVRELLEDLAKRFPNRRLQVMSPLAEGADRLVGLVAEDLGIDLIVPLPMPENLYTQDFESSRSWAEFGRLHRYATERTTVPLAPGNTEDAISDYGPERNRQYAEAGAWVAARSDILVAIWDGKTLDDLGGTGQVVKFRREGEMPDYVPHASSKPTRNVVFHIVCSRSRVGGEPAEGLAPLQKRWLGAEGEAYGRFPLEWIDLLNTPIDEKPADAPATAKRPGRALAACRAVVRPLPWTLVPWIWSSWRPR